MPRSILPFIACSLALGSAAACGSSADGASPSAPSSGDAGQDVASPDADMNDAVDAGPDVDNGAPSTTYPAPHPELPQLVNQAGGKVLTTPKIHLVVFPGYEHQAEMVDLATKIGGSPYWASAIGEYGVGAATYDGITVLTGETAPATIHDSDIASYLSDKIAAGAFGQPDPNTIYTIVYPKGTSIQMNGSPLGPSASCTSFGGYHEDVAVTVDGHTQNFPYAVIPTCAAFGGMSEIDGLTGAASHEWLEAVTDPFPVTGNGADAAFSGVDQDHFIWLILGGTEDGDLCIQEPNAFFTPKEIGHTVQRAWSNKAAAAGHEPCVPALDGPFFAAAPVLDESVTLNLPAGFGGSATTRGVTIPVGQSKTIEVDLFSDGATSGPVAVSAQDGLARVTKSAPTLAFSWDRTTGVNGEKLHLTITVKSAAALVAGAHPFIITATLGARRFAWPGLVVE